MEGPLLCLSAITLCPLRVIMPGIGERAVVGAMPLGTDYQLANPEADCSLLILTVDFQLHLHVKVPTRPSSNTKQVFLIGF